MRHRKKQRIGEALYVFDSIDERLFLFLIPFGCNFSSKLLILFENSSLIP